LPRFICLYNAQTSIWTWQEWMSVKWYWCATVVFLCEILTMLVSLCVLQCCQCLWSFQTRFFQDGTKAWIGDLDKR
jgi:hypothetical protein